MLPPDTIEINQLRLRAKALGMSDEEIDLDAEKSYTSGTYNGDLHRNDFSDKPETGYKAFEFESPFEVVTAFDPVLNEGRLDEDGNPYSLHVWQMEVNEFLASVKPTSKKPCRFALCAANGSGKDKYVIAPFVVWFAMTKIKSLCIITSSSGVQLTSQTENYIASLCNEVNARYGRRVFKITRRFIKCLETGSEIRMFATDEAGKAEGYHPLEPGAEMCIIVNEAKSVAPEIFGALDRCTGYNYRLHVSTPGEPYGDFHDSFINWTHKRRVSAFDCPHLSADHIAEMKRKHGENSFIYRSQVLALFTAFGGKVVIDQDYLNACIAEAFKKDSKPLIFGKKRLGVDLAAGRDECAFVVSHGNTVIDRLFFQEKDTTITEERLEKFILKHGGLADLTGKNHGDLEIYADDGGVGHGIIDRLARKGYNITRVLNQSRAIDHKQFGNRGAEMWYNLARMVEEKTIFLNLDTNNPEERKIYEQLCYRHYKKNETSGRITLESKEEARANGHVSPDRADAYVLSFSPIDFSEIQAEKLKAKPPAPVGMTIEEIMAEKYNRHKQMILGTGEQKSKTIENNSIETYLANKRN